MGEIGRSIPRVDAKDKVCGTAKYTEDLCPAYALTAKIYHAAIANGWVERIDIDDALAVPGVEAVFTCMDVPQLPFATAGHPWSTDPGHRDVADRLLLNRRVRCYGDDIAVVVATDEVAADRGLRAIRVEYREEPVAVTPEQAMEMAAQGGEPLHEAYADNILGRSQYQEGEWPADTEELTAAKGSYVCQAVQHCHLESAVSFAWQEGEKITVVSSTQIPHIVRRVVGQALGLPWSRIRVIKPYIGGGFGNKQDVLTEPLNAWLAQKLPGRTVKLCLSREEVFSATRIRHPITIDIETLADQQGNLVARSYNAVSCQGAYASHGHGIAANGMTAFRDMYRQSQALRQQALTVYCNVPAAGAMRGYGIPQETFATEANMDDLALALAMDPLELRRKNMMLPGFKDPVTGITCHSSGLEECLRKGEALIDWQAKRQAYAKQSGPLRRGVGMALFCYKTGVYPLSLETSSARMVLNQDGSAQLHLGATEIGQGGDTVFAQMAAEACGMRTEDIRVVSFQDTDVAPYDSGAYASRQTYVTGMAIQKTARLFGERLTGYAAGLCGMAPENLRVQGQHVVKQEDGQPVISLEELAQEAFYSLENSVHISAQTTNHCRSNTFAFGCSFVEIQVDMPLGQIRVLQAINLHDSGKLINPALAEAQVHGGMSMALGYGLSERMIFHPQSGKLLNGNLLDYKLATALDTPDLQAVFVETQDPTGPFGNKALGEPPALSLAPALRNALLHATGVKINSLPLEPQRLTAAFREAGLLEGGEDHV
ncbi:MAG: xanthine dehydrogenase molybdenum-binding subunit XdhA [Firmicutes bacterium]|nr:xanthine dehydrogenase molybdenum-binding subunit XdhA [Bacillota bacterium]